MSTYAPRRCGIATFTHDLASAVGAREIVALHPVDEPGPYPIEVRHRIRRDVLADYQRVGQALDEGRVDVVSIQHESGIWGGDDGDYVVDFARGLRTPAVATLHTVLRHPTRAQRRILVDLVDACEATVVLSCSAASLLARAYGVDPARIDVVSHGVPQLPLVDPNSVKPRLGLEGRAVILSFGLLGPDKGYESAIEAMPAAIRADPSVCYVILGATHPDRLRREGDVYRRGLEEQVARLGLANHVRFVNEFVGHVQLGAWLEAADIVVTPYVNPDRVVSGTLSYAMGAGKAIVSTPFPYASELLAGGRGMLIAPGSAVALASAFVELLGDADLRASLGRQAHAHATGMVWWQVGAAYRRIFARASTRPRGPGVAVRVAVARP